MKIAFDVKLMKPGCAIIQAAHGIPGRIASEFDTKYWLLAPTPDIGVYEVTEEQLKQLVQMVRDRHK